MNALDKSDPSKPVILVYTPYLQGLYIGELVNQIRQLCFIKGHRFVVIRTGDYGRFNEHIHLNNISAVIIIRNAISTDLAEYILTQEIACVSIAYDYFPLSMPMVTSDNAHGINLAFDHLQALGHRRIAFVGDLSHYDIRKRYEFYCERHEIDAIELHENYLINTQDTLVCSGASAANAFIQDHCDATAVIFGAGLTAIGFIQRMRLHAQDQPSKLDYICFDAIPLIPVFAPEVTTVNQNIHLLAYRAFNTIEHQLQHQPFQRHLMVAPQITRLGTPPNESVDAFITTCVDFQELNNANYVKSLLCNFFDWPREIINSQLDQLMSISLLFQKFMGRAILSRYYVDAKDISWLKIIKVYAPGDTQICELSDAESLCKATHFPPKGFASMCDQYGSCMHMPITVNGKIWGWLSLLGDPSCPTPASSYFGFSGYIESIVKMYEQQLEIAQLKKRLQSLNDTHIDTATSDVENNATIEWIAEGNQTSWSDAALAKLGFNSAIEINIFRNMEITDRIHPSHAEKARVSILECKQSRNSVQFRARYRGKNNIPIDMVMDGNPQLDDNQKFKGIIFSLRKEDMEQ
jgi:DNA-binding LacI/PurR family transcriptional regulator